MAQADLFSTWYNTLLALLCLWLLWELVPPLVRWALLDADFSGTSREDCTSGGACWVFIKARFGSSSTAFTRSTGAGVSISLSSS